MKNPLRTFIATTALALGAALAITPAHADPYTYDQFSQFGHPAAGQLTHDDTPASQFAWRPQAPDLSDIYWGIPTAWPPPTFERFHHVGDWLLLEGYGDNTSRDFLPQIITSESLGNGDCQHMAPIATDGREKYVLWNTPDSSYCLHSIGYMDYHGTRVDFDHTQIWAPPAPCGNSNHPHETCITQHDIWLDNNGNPGGPIAIKIERDNSLALGKGWLTIRDWVGAWTLQGRDYWTYQL